MKRALGNWVVGDDFWGREPELHLFMEDLEEGANVLLTAPRRVGKTSLMREAARRLEGRFTCLQIDLQKAHSAADAIVEISIATRPYLNLWGKTKGLFGSALDKITGAVESLHVHELAVTLRSGITAKDWQPKGDRLLEVLAESERPVIIFLDEVPILVNRLLQGEDFNITPERKAEADAFMSWLRENSIRHRKKLRIVVTGSIGFEPILHLAGLNATLNTFTPFTLGPWNDDTATEFILLAAKEYGLTFVQGAEKQLIFRLGACIPHYVQVFFDRIYKHAKLNGFSEIPPSVVDEVYDSEMLSVRGHAELTHLEERLRMVLGPSLFPFALELLTETAVTGSLTREAADAIAARYQMEDKLVSDRLHEVLGILEHDLYLKQNISGEFVFVSKLVRDWWRARFGFGYRPALQKTGSTA
jgi:hypothetical protein